MQPKDIQYLEETYFLLRRKKIYAFLGGVFAFIIASGGLSYYAALQTI